MSVKYFGSDALNKLIDLVKTALGLKADNVSGATADDIATLTSGGNLKDSGISSLKVVDTGFVASAEIKNNVSANALGLDVKIEPNQDLHGYDYPWVGGAGKNKLNYDAWKTVGVTKGTAVWENNGVTLTATQDDAYTNWGDNFPTGARVPVTQGQTVTLSWEETTNKNGSVYIFPNGSTSGLVWCENANTKSLSYTPTSGITYIVFRFGVRTSGETISYKNIQIEYGSTATSFEPYSNICSISGRVSISLNFVGDTTVSDYILLGSSYYGGMYNVLTGGLLVDRLIATFDGSDDEGWNATNGKTCETQFLSSVIKRPANNNTVANIISNRFKAVTANGAYTGTIGISADTGGYINLDIDGAQHTTAEYKTWLSNNPLQVVYELAEPITVERVPRTINLPSGNSTGTASTGDIRVKYEKKFTDYYDDEIEELDSKAVKIVDGQPLFKYYQKTIGTIGPSAGAAVGNWQRLIIAKPVIPGYTIFTAFISDYMSSGSTSLMMELVFSLSDSSSYLIFEANKTIQGVKVTYVAVRSDLISAVS